MQQHPLFDFDKCSSSNFKRNSQTIANRVLRFEGKHTGLSKDFKGFIKEVLAKRPDIFEGVEEEEFDADCKDNEGEDNIRHISGAEDKVSLSEGLKDSRFSNDPSEQPPITEANVLLHHSRRSQSKKQTPKAVKQAVKQDNKQAMKQDKNTDTMPLQNDLPGM